MPLGHFFNIGMGGANKTISIPPCTGLCIMWLPLLQVLLCSANGLNGAGNIKVSSNSAGRTDVPPFHFAGKSSRSRRNGSRHIKMRTQKPTRLLRMSNKAATV